MDIGNLIQVGIFIILSVTLISIYLQMRIQNRIHHEQLIYHRYELFNSIFDPITDDNIRNIKSYPDMYLDKETFDHKYKKNNVKIIKLLLTIRIYIYFVMIHALRLNKLSDPFNIGIIKWMDELEEDEDFQVVAKELGSYYPSFQKFLNDRLSKVKNDLE